MRTGYLGPEGTYTHAAARGAVRAGDPDDLVPYASIPAVVHAVAAQEIERGLVPIENSLEGSVNATLDALVAAPDVRIQGEVVSRISHCLVAARTLEAAALEDVLSHPQALAQCAGYLQARLPHAAPRAVASTAEAIRMVVAHDGRWAAIGSRAAAERYGAVILEEGIEDEPENHTRFVWLGRADRPLPLSPGGGDPMSRPRTALVFWGAGAESPGWLVACLREFAMRGVNLTRIESRPSRRGLGSYMFFCDVDGRAADPSVTDALHALKDHVEVVRILGQLG